MKPLALLVAGVLAGLVLVAGSCGFACGLVIGLAVGT